jgi:hypothetical protein
MVRLNPTVQSIMWPPKSPPPPASPQQRQRLRRDQPRALLKRPGVLMRRAQQWLAARERRLWEWIMRTHLCARASMQARAQVRRHARVEKLGGEGAILLPQWWEYESPLKRRLALEATLRRMFSLLQEIPIFP